MKISDTPLLNFFKTTSPILATTPYLWLEKWRRGDPTML